tara:strand:- start:4174 stop:4401 length:228 start_codon:yes stop_codon:yes gene_type:complete
MDESEPCMDALERYVEAYDALQQYKKEIREATKERTAEVNELGEALRSEMIAKGLDELEFNDRVIQLETKLQISK